LKNLKKMRANLKTQNQFEAKLEAMQGSQEIRGNQASQDRKLKGIKGQIKNQEQKLDCGISKVKSEMKTRIGTLEEKVYKRIGGVEKTKLTERSH